MTAPAWGDPQVAPQAHRSRAYLPTASPPKRAPWPAPSSVPPRCRWTDRIGEPGAFVPAAFHHPCKSAPCWNERNIAAGARFRCHAAGPARRGPKLEGASPIQALTFTHLGAATTSGPGMAHHDHASATNDGEQGRTRPSLHCPNGWHRRKKVILVIFFRIRHFSV